MSVLLFGTDSDRLNNVRQMRQCFEGYFTNFSEIYRTDHPGDYLRIHLAKQLRFCITRAHGVHNLSNINLQKVHQDCAPNASLFNYIFGVDSTCKEITSEIYPLFESNRYLNFTENYSAVSGDNISINALFCGKEKEMRFEVCFVYDEHKTPTSMTIT